MEQRTKEDFYSRIIKDYNFTLDHSGVSGDRIASRLYEISKIGTTDSGGANRTGYSIEEKKAKELVIGWMKAAGMTITIDGAGNVFGKIEGRDESPSVVSGSHVDSVPNGGHFDGTLGVIAALEVVESWNSNKHIPKNPFEIVIFSDEEGSRFRSGLIGSRAFMGQIDQKELANLRDEQGKTFNEVIVEYGLEFEDFKNMKNNKDIMNFVEVHIEQGKILEKVNQPVGIVSGIAGPAWLEVTFIGEAGHAGNTPMPGRKDPLIASAIFIESIEKFPQIVSNTAVATIGKLDVYPNGVNVIAQDVQLTVDIRDIHENTRDKLLELIYKEAENIAKSRDIDVNINYNSSIKPLPIQKRFQDKLAESISKFEVSPTYIPSGAGHDAMVLGKEFPVAMLFVRSKDGISHNPNEWSSLNDCVMAVHILRDYIESIMKETE
ncbi:M20 family metallo-hydrolase [Virgibacillus byunsanensis]|uniref:M20 family metallo-hydrolase n=1 Tax=Virgibacillus byunsanensis TaxID=570945 RepID=A0ABW3LJV1_9BACI